MNKSYMIACIKNLISKNYELNPDIFDLESMVDSKLSFEENWKEVKKLVLLNCPIDKILSTRTDIPIIEQVQEVEFYEQEE